MAGERGGKSDRPGVWDGVLPGGAQSICNRRARNWPPHLQGTSKTRPLLVYPRSQSAPAQANRNMLILQTGIDMRRVKAELTVFNNDKC